MHDARLWLLVLVALLGIVLPLLLRRMRLSPRWLLLGALVLGSASALVLRRESLEDLTPDRLETARADWSRASPADYDLEVLVRADRLAEGHFEIQVRGGELTSARHNGIPATGAPDAYTVPGLFDVLARELELARDPTAGFGAPAGYRAYLKVRFHRELGYPQKYRRVVGGTTNGVEISVLRLVPMG